MGRRLVCLTCLCLSAFACVGGTPTEPSFPVVNAAKPISRAPALNFPAGIYRFTVRASDQTIVGTDYCSPRGILPTSMIVQTEVELVASGAEFTVRALHPADTLTLRLRDAGPNYIGSREVRGTAGGRAIDRSGLRSDLTSSVARKFRAGLAATKPILRRRRPPCSFLGPSDSLMWRGTRRFAAAC